MYCKTLTINWYGNQKVEYLLHLRKKYVADELEGFPPIKMHCSNLAADALKAAIDNYRTGAEPDVVVASSCQLEISVILGFDEFLGKGAYKEIPENLEEFRDKRILLVDSGDDSLDLSLKLTEYTGRVIVVTSSKEVPGREEIAKKLKKSDVKILQQSELLEIKGELDEGEKVVIHDFDEDENYDLFVDVVIYLDYRG